jgi:phage baseplate assembly protein W
MPIPLTTQINPLDLQGNIAIGISLPFNGPVAFNSTYSTYDQIKSNLINLLLTNKGERVFNPEFGSDLRSALFEGLNEDIDNEIRSLITTNAAIFVPEVTITNLDIIQDKDNNSLSVSVQYRINISNKTDQITVQFI